MNILDLIAAAKKLEIRERKYRSPVRILEKSIFFNRNTLSLREELVKESSPAIIAEFKRKSPTRGIINYMSDLTEVCKGYIGAGASAVSILTDRDYFGGTLEDMLLVRQNINCAVLRKDFIIDEYQIIEARSYGADAILLITELLPSATLERLFRFAYSMGLDVMVEVHDKNNISKIPYDTKIIGINSRNLNSFDVNIDHLRKIIKLIPGNLVKVAESGIRSSDDCLKLYRNGFDAFLIGEHFMSSTDPGKICKDFIDEIRNRDTSSFEKRN